MRDDNDFLPEGVDPTEPAIDHSQGTPFFKSVSGLKSDNEVSDYQEGGVSGGTQPSGGTLEFTSGDPQVLSVELPFDDYEPDQEVTPARSGALDAADTSAIREAATPPPPANTATPADPAQPSEVPGPPQIKPPGVLEAKAPGPPHRRPGSSGRIGIVLGGVLGVIVLGGILAVVVQGGRLPFFPRPCDNPQGQRGPGLALLADPPAPCANSTAVATMQPTTIPQATNTPLPEPTATTAPQPTNTAQAKPPHLNVTPVQAAAFCLNGSYPSLTVKNTGGKTLTWSASGPSNPPVTLTPASGNLAPGATQVVTVSGQHPGPTVTIAFTSNGGAVLVTFTCS